MVNLKEGQCNITDLCVSRAEPSLAQFHTIFKERLD